MESEIFDKSETVKIDLQEIRALRCPVHFVLTEEALKRYNELEAAEMEGASRLDNPYVGRYFNYLIVLADILLVDDVLGAMKEGGGFTVILRICMIS